MVESSITQIKGEIINRDIIGVVQIMTVKRLDNENLKELHS